VTRDYGTGNKYKPPVLVLYVTSLCSKKYDALGNDYLNFKVNKLS